MVKSLKLFLVGCAWLIAGVIIGLLWWAGHIPNENINAVGAITSICVAGISLMIASKID